MRGAGRMLFNGLTLVPGADRMPILRHHLERRMTGTGGTCSARYCYAVWLRHLVLVAEHGLNPDPKNVAELGPGDSIGTGVAALLCGAERYAALDVVRHAEDRRNLEVFEELVELVGRRTDIPDEQEFPHLRPTLASYRFPSSLLSARRLERALAPARLAAIRGALQGGNPGGPIRYFVPWSDPAVVPVGSQDLVFSQAVLEHVDALPEAYAAMRRWLRPGGCLSHQVDLKSHNSAPTWDGHWRLGPLRWNLTRGRRLWYINRQPWSEHLRLLAEAGFRVVWTQLARTPPTFDRDALAAPFRHMPEDDRSISGGFVLAVPGDTGPWPPLAL